MTASDNPAGQPEFVPKVADHQLLRRIGAGSGGQVWLARTTLGTYRAVKIIYRRSFALHKPFEDELHGLVKFEPLSRQHDGLVDVLQVGGDPTGDFFYCVMELADDVATGPHINPDRYQPRTLACDLSTRRRRPVGECIRVGVPIASALGFLHRQGLIHRDVKPANIIFINGFPKLVDAGLVTEMFKPSSHVGTEGYIPPEGQGTVRSDIYALGKVLYEISTGKDRFDYPELPADLRPTIEDQDLIRFNKIILRACRTNPRLRFRDAEELTSALLAFEFGKHAPSREQKIKTLDHWLRIAGITVALSVISYMVWHIVWLLRHSG